MESTAADTAHTRKVIATLYAAAISGDVVAALSCMHPEVEVVEADHLPFGGSYHGHDGITQVFGALAQHLDLSRLAIRTLIADGHHGLAVVTVPVRRKGTSATVAEHWQLQDGLIRRGQVFVFDPSALLEPA